MLFAASLSALSLVSAAAAQMTIQVGAEATSTGGVFQFIPSNTKAPNGTVVTFQFTGVPGNHSVTQSTFADPCDPAVGGFDSGWVLIPTAGLASVPSWNVTITDDSKPIWFFCKQLHPQAHCLAGMVGSINAPATGNNTFAAFQANAKNFKGSPGQGEGALAGIGASASAGVGNIPSGATPFTGVPLSASPSGSSGTIAVSVTSGSAPSATAPPASGSSAGAPAPSAPASGASGIVASMLSVAVAAVAALSLL